jgi:shikimate kinase/3-dehydroquinate synthase
LARLSATPRGALVLIGFMGAGKSTVASELARALGSEAYDSDAMLEARLGKTVAEAFADAAPEQSGVASAAASQRATALAGPPAAAAAPAGEMAFRAREEELVCELLAQAAPGTVLALGGGSVLSERVRRALERHVVVLLHVDPQEAWRRVSAAQAGTEGAPKRPLAQDRESFVALYEQRLPLYEELADAHLPPFAPGGAARALAGLRVLALLPVGTRMVWAASRSGEYPVLIGSGLLEHARAPQLLEAWSLGASSRAFCVSDEHVAPLYGARVGDVARTVTIPPGEQHKSLACAERVWEGLLAGGMTRADHLLALGGGVVGDLAGFCAATYQRGVPVVQVPTTLLAQVDSAYGGKTGVDLPHAKNYVGAYHQPAGVLADLDTLATLPPAELAAGWVEVLKTALIAGGALWRRVLEGAETDARTIAACARVKLQIVAEDERDEAASGYARYRHGEAVGLGLLAALRLSGRAELRSQVQELLATRGLPVKLEGVEVEDVIDALARDKKRTGDRVPFVLLEAPGRVRSGCVLSSSEVASAVAELAG